MEYKFVMRRSASGRGAIVSSPDFPGESLRAPSGSVVVGLRAVAAVREIMASRRKVTRREGTYVPPFTITVGTMSFERGGFVPFHAAVSYGKPVSVRALGMGNSPWENLGDEQSREFVVSGDVGDARYGKFRLADFICEPPSNFV